MPAFSLTALELWELREHTRTAIGRVALRALMVLWRAEGLTTLEIAQRLDCHRDTVSLWLARYQAHGLAGLEDEPRSGRPPHLDAATRTQTETLLDQPPPEDDQPRACWTLAHLRTVLLALAPKAFGLSTLRQAVQALGFRWRRPRLWAHQEDPGTFAKTLLVALAQQKATEQAAATPPSEAPSLHFLYADASDQHLLAVVRSMWMRRGQQVRIATPPQNGKWALFGSLNVLTGVFFWQAYEQARSTSFIAFLTYLLECYPTGELLLVVDNASYHTSRQVVAWLKAHPRILLLYLPTRRPDLNPVEPLWDALKAAVSANRSFADREVLFQFIQRFFARLTPKLALQLAGVRRDFSTPT